LLPTERSGNSITMESSNKMEEEFYINIEREAGVCILYNEYTILISN